MDCPLRRTFRTTLTTDRTWGSLVISFRSCDGLRWSRQPTAGRRRRPVSLVMLLVGAVVLLSACSLPGYGTPEAVTKQGDNIDRLWKASAAAALIVGVIVWGLILWAVFRYRKRSDELPRQVGHNTPSRSWTTPGRSRSTGCSSSTRRSARTT